MLALLSLYSLTIIASTVLGAGLALLGTQLAARDRAMQTMCVGQGAMLGVLLGVGLSQVLHASSSIEAVVPFILAFAAASVTFAASERFVSRKAASSNTHFSALFVSLLAGGYLVSALFPALENHMAQKYFGDLATVSESAATAVLVAGSGILVALCVFQRAITRDSFATAILAARVTPTGLLFALGTLAALCFSVQVVGFLFTASCLFIPTSILSFGRDLGLRRHLVTSACTAGLSCCVGFVASLWFTKLPTVPTIVVVMAATAATLNGFRKVLHTK